MKSLLLAFFAGFSIAAATAADVAVSVSVGQPGYYGRLDVGDMPHPQLLYPQVVIVTPVVGVVRAPVYLRVPPGHAKDWAKHCHKYGACGDRVYFVNDAWYNDVYVPHYQRRHGKPHAPGKGKDKHKD